MSRFALFAILTFALAPEARAALPDACGHSTRAEHVQGCEARRGACAETFGPSSRVQHGLTHCRIGFDQCMSRAVNEPTVR
jgi:hypothetical protein